MPAAGPLTLVCDPLNIPTRMPPTIPDSNPENKGAPEASATPRHKGRATRNTTRPAVKSCGRVVDNGPFAGGMDESYDERGSSETGVTLVYGEQFEDVPVGIAEIDATAAIVMIDGSILQC